MAEIDEVEYGAEDVSDTVEVFALTVSSSHEKQLAQGGLSIDLVKRAQSAGLSLVAILAMVLKHGPSAVEVLKTILDLLVKGKKALVLVAFLAVCGGVQAGERLPRPRFVPRPSWPAPMAVQTAPRPAQPVYWPASYPVVAQPIRCGT